MSSKRYQFKVIEAKDTATLETQLRDAGRQQWSAVGYGVTADGQRSVLLQRKVKIHGHHHDRRHHHGTDDHARPRAQNEE